MMAAARSWHACSVLDGTDQCDVVKAEGQTNLEEHPTEAIPGKEYLLLVSADGTWELEFTEGY